mmetsp:Transcript_9289/g.27210  ORF Transcript_9289/g.27210 Transcript_9289/m.27210 type:complete len:120 (+) Transcript_9289:1322-1681(+)
MVAHVCMHSHKTPPTSKGVKHMVFMVSMLATGIMVSDKRPGQSATHITLKDNKDVKKHEIFIYHCSICNRSKKTEQALKYQSQICKDSGSCNRNQRDEQTINEESQQYFPCLPPVGDGT